MDLFNRDQSKQVPSYLALGRSWGTASLGLSLADKTEPEGDGQTFIFVNMNLQLSLESLVQFLKGWLICIYGRPAREVLTIGVTAICRFQADQSRQNHVFATDQQYSIAPSLEVKEVWTGNSRRTFRPHLLHVGSHIALGFFFKLR